MSEQHDTNEPMVSRSSSDSEAEIGNSSFTEKEHSIRKESKVQIHNTNTREQHARAWKTSWWRFGPLSGIFCMFVGVACIIASLGILAGSNGEEIGTWPTPPSTYLAIFTAVANLSMRYAAIQGVVIAWWVQALKGSTISRLHWDWRSGTTLRGALTAGRHMGLLGIACIFSTVVVVDGPLLQRSSTVVTADLDGHLLPLNITMAQELPRGYTGAWSTMAEAGEAGQTFNVAFNDSLPSPKGSAKNTILATSWPRLDLHVSELWNQDKPLDGVVHGCDGQCMFKFLAPALFETSCIEEQHVINYEIHYDAKKVITTVNAPPINSQVFSVGMNLLVDDEKEKVILVTGASNTYGRVELHSQCNSTLTVTSCVLEQGIGEYHAFVKNDKIQMETLSSPKVVAMSNNTKVVRVLPQNMFMYPSTLGGVVGMMYTRWAQLVAYYKPNGSYPLPIALNSPVTEAYLRPGNQECPTYLSAREDVIDSLNKLMVYLGAFAAHHIRNHWEHEHNDGRLDPEFGEVRQSVEGYPAGIGNVYRTHYEFFIAAAIVEIVCLALVAPTYWGWWNIGRPVSFSPLELSKAFDSSIMSHCDPNSSGRDLAKAFDDTPIKYGAEVSGHQAKARIVFGSPSVIATPTSGQVFDGRSTTSV